MRVSEVRPLLLNLTTSLDGFIADSTGGIDWIQPPPDDPGGLPADYVELMEAVDTLVMGRATYELSLALSGGMDVFESKCAVVFTSRPDLPPHRGVEFSSEDPVALVRRMKGEPGGTIWLYGGGMLATTLATAGLIDDYLIVVQPLLLGDGIRLWRDGLRRVPLELRHVREWIGGLVELRYVPRR
jgi:dihydrofolate reductase